MPAVYAGPIARILNIKFINGMIADAPRKLSREQRVRSAISFPFSDVIQANSHAGIKSYNAPERKAAVVHNGFDFKRIEGIRGKDEIREDLGIRTPKAVGMVALFKARKDYESLISAAGKILEERNDVSFICVGNGPNYDKIKGMAENRERIIFTGKRDDVESIINIFDIGVLLTDLEKHGEGISNSIMEYMALGKPVIATRGGGTVELVIDGQTGFLIPQKSPDILVKKIRLLMDNEDLMIRMGEKGRQRIRNEFSLQSMVEKQISIYQKLLAD